MFSGIIGASGKVVQTSIYNNILTIKIYINNIEACAIGDSIAINGVCLTATKIDGPEVTFDIVKETLLKTTLGDLSIDDEVNVEFSLKMGGRIGGHIVQGHVDEVGTISYIDKQGDALLVAITTSNLFTKILNP